MRVDILQKKLTEEEKKCNNSNENYEKTKRIPTETDLL
jgi:hypothetical protein